MKKRHFVTKITETAGMTMIEVSIAAVVLMGAVIIIMTMLNTAVGILRFTTSRSLATQIANEALEDMRSVDYSQAVLYDGAGWPDDPDLDKHFNPPKYKDVDSTGTVTWRSLLTTDTAAALQVEKSRERQHIVFLIRRYVFYVSDGAVAQAFKRLVVKVKWIGTDHPGEVVMTTNYALTDSGNPRPLSKILGIRSSNYNYLTNATEDTTVGEGDSIRGPRSGVSQPQVQVEAVVTGAKASYIDRVGFKLYSPTTGLVVAETTVTSASVVNGKYFVWNGASTPPFNTTLRPDGIGYVVRTEAVDDRGKSDFDAMTFNIDNTSPKPTGIPEDFLFGTRALLIKWSPGDVTGDAAPQLARFIILRADNGGWAGSFGVPQAIAAVPGGKNYYVDAGLASGYRYQYKVKAIDTAGNFAESSPKARVAAIGTPLVDGAAPNAVPAATVDAVAWSTISLSWIPATDNGSSGMGGYQIRARDTAAGTSMVIDATTDTVNNPLYYSDEGLKPNKTYYYSWRAFDNEGNLGPEWESPYTYGTTLKR
ncbi:MAG: hypothetical protein Q8L35_01035 [Actinomycetota bacterium]|nr:hypothetical protein [Actinomycetota bacterium]